MRGKVTLIYCLTAALLLFGAQWGMAADTSLKGEIEVHEGDPEMTIENKELVLKDGPPEGNKGVILADGGKITMTDGSLTLGQPSLGTGAATSVNGGNINLTNVKIETLSGISGQHRYGLNALYDGKITMTGGSIETDSQGSNGANAVNDGEIALTNVDITTHEGSSSGLQSGSGGKITMTGGRVTTTGASLSDSVLHVAVYSVGGEIELEGVTVRTTGERGSVGLAAEQRSPAYRAYVHANSTTVETIGRGSNGIVASQGGVVDFTNGSVTTTGASSNGAYSYHNSSINITNGTITTAGDYAYGLLAWDSKLSADKTAVHTKGNNAYGAISQTYTGINSAMDLSDVTIETEGKNAHAVVARDGCGVTLAKGATLTVRDGTGSNALYARDNGTIEAKEGVYRITGDVVQAGAGAIGVDYADGSLFTGGTAIESTGTIDYKMSGSALWNLTKNSTLTTLQMEDTGAAVDMTRDGGAFGTLTARDLRGEGGTFVMDTKIADETADKVIVSGTTAGTHTIDVKNQGGAATTGDERTTVVETADRGGAFQLKNGAVDAGAWRYEIQKNDDGKGQFDAAGGQYWELVAAGPSNPGTTGVNTFIGTYFLNYAETDTLMKRLGDLRGNAEDGAWFRGFGGNMDSGARKYAGAFDMDYWGMQVGYDHKLDRQTSWFKNGDTYVGAFIGVSNGDMDFEQYGSGTGDLENHTMGMYATFIGDDGFYFDAIAKYVWSKNEFTAQDSANQLVQGGRINTGGVGLSLETGKRINFGKEAKRNHGRWYVEPQVQLSWQHMGGATFHADNGLSIGVDDFDSLIGRAGALVGYESDKTNIYVKASYLKEFDGEMRIKANGAAIDDSLDDDWIVYGIGVTRQMDDRNSFYVDLERAAGGEFDQDWNLNAGWRISF